ncbi:MAG: type II toxin-antitoxin system VapC family toxin [Chloroflexota bacterium]
MALFYLDTSALVKRYSVESGSPWIIELMSDHANRFALTRAAGPELIAALARKTRTGELSTEDCLRASFVFRSDWESVFVIIELTTAVAGRAMDLALSHGLRGYDSIHLASAQELNEIRQQASLAPLTFISADSALCSAAGAQGLGIENPNHHS